MEICTGCKLNQRTHHDDDDDDDNHHHHPIAMNPSHDVIFSGFFVVCLFVCFVWVFLCFVFCFLFCFVLCVGGGALNDCILNVYQFLNLNLAKAVFFCQMTPFNVRCAHMVRYSMVWRSYTLVGILHHLIIISLPHYRVNACRMYSVDLKSVCLGTY